MPPVLNCKIQVMLVGSFRVLNRERLDGASTDAKVPRDLVYGGHLAKLINNGIRGKSSVKVVKVEDGDVLPAAGPAERSVIGLFADRAAG